MEIHEDTIVYRRGSSFEACGEISRTVLGQDADAAKVIRGAIECLPPEGGRVRLAPGEFTIGSAITIPDHVTLEGSGRGTRITCVESFTEEAALILTESKGVVLSNFAVMDSGDSKRSGVILDNCGDCKVLDLHIQELNGHGIVLRNNTFLTEVRGATIQLCKGSGVFMENCAGGGRGGDFVPNLIANCMVTRCGKGFELSNAIVVNLLGCIVYQTRSYAFHFYGDSNSVLLTGCRTFQIEDDAILVENSHEINITSNIFCWHTGHGIVLKDVSWGTICGNNVIDNGSANPCDAEAMRELNREGKQMLQPWPDTDFQKYEGILLTGISQGLTVTGNAVFNWYLAPPMGCGIREESTCGSNVIHSNNINYTERPDLSIEGTGSMAHANLVIDKEPYRGTEGMIQVFLPQFIEEFIRNR